MGSAFQIECQSKTEDDAREIVDSCIVEITRIERMISYRDSTSYTYSINHYAGKKAIKVSKEYFDFVERCLNVSKLTDGAFDISAQSYMKSYVFDQKERDISQQIESKFNYQDIVLNHQDTTVYLSKLNMMVGFGAIGKGYAAKKALQRAKALGASACLVNAGGDMTFWGEMKHSNIPVAIASPDTVKSILGWLALQNTSVVTSGNYEKYFTVNGKKHCHIINPKRGHPVTGIQSVTIICADAELADALATAVMVLGIKNGLALIEQLHQVECIIYDDANHIYSSSNINYE